MCDDGEGCPKKQCATVEIGIGRGLSKEECVFCGAPMVIGSRDLGLRGVQKCSS